MSVDELDSSPQAPEITITGLLEEWFVLYNPFYVASACLTLSGAWQLSLGIAALGWKDGRILPTIVLSVYQLLLALASVAVARSGSIRPAVNLALVSTLFIVDPTLQHVQIALHARRGIGLGVAFVSLLVLAMVATLLPRALAVSLNRSFVWILFITAGGIVFAPHLLDARIFTESDAFLLLEVWSAAIFIAAVRFPVRIEAAATDEWTTTVARRASVYLTALFPAAAVLHLKGWADVFEPSIDWRSMVIAAVTLMVVRRNEPLIWTGAVAAFVLAMSHPTHGSPILLLLAGVLLVLWFGGLHYRLAVGSIVAAWMAVSMWGWQGDSLPNAPSWATLLAIALLTALALKRRSLLALLPMPLILRATQWSAGDVGPMVRGIVLVSSGFFLLGAGVIANLYARLSRSRAG